ncbi:MAG: hypothetical protein RIT27_1908 [Pseudomonadota bacterium]|jgi:photosystem II stability/assembly factor-like uncharacterized protein
MNPLYVKLSLSVAIASLLSGAVFANARIEQVVPFSDNEVTILYNQKLYKMSPVGQDWSDISPKVQSGQVKAVKFVDSQHGWAVVYEKDRGYSLVRTTDAGNSWTELVVSNIEQSDIASAYLEFVDTQVGWLVVKDVTSRNFSSGSLFRTEDGGVTWTLLNIPVGEPVHFISRDIGWVIARSTDNQIYRTEDGGNTWNKQHLVDDEIITSATLPTFKTHNEGFLSIFAKPKLNIFSTKNSGETWELAKQVIVPDNFESISVGLFDDNNYIVTYPNIIVGFLLNY